MRQQTLAEEGFEKHRKKTRREQFLDDMDRIIPWSDLAGVVEPFYPKPQGAGRRPIGIERMLRIHFLQHWFNLSDPAVEEALYDSRAMRRFVGIDLGREPVPDETTICKFRHLLEAHNLGEQLFVLIQDYLQENGLKVSRGTIVDATIINAPSSTKNQDGERDPEMRQTNVKRHPVLRIKATPSVAQGGSWFWSAEQSVEWQAPVPGDTGAGGSGLMTGGQGGLELPQPVASALDVEDVAVMQEPVEDGGGQDLVAGEDLRPGLDALVGGDDDRALLVAVGDQAEEQRGILAAHRLEADLVEDQQAVVDVLLATQERGRELGIAAHQRQQLVEAVEDHAEAVFDGLDAEGDGQVGLAHAGRTLDQQGALLADPLAGAERLDAGAFHGGLEAEVEVAQRLAGGQAGEPERSLQAALLTPLELGVEQLVDQQVRGGVVLDRLADQALDALGGVDQAEALEALAGDIEIDAGCGLAVHRATSARAAYRFRGRCSGGRAEIAASRAPIRPSGIGAMTWPVLGPS